MSTTPGAADRPAHDAERAPASTPQQGPGQQAGKDAARTPGPAPDSGHDAKAKAGSGVAGPAGRPGGAASKRRPDGGKDTGPRKAAGPDNSAWGVFRAVVVAVGVLIAAMGAYYLVAGTGGVAGNGGGEVNASLESQFRFFAMMMVGVGAAFVAIAVKFQWSNMLWLVCLMVFLGGIGRVMSWAFSGTPHITMIVLMILELAFPPALLVWHRFIAKTVALRAEYAGRQGGPVAGGAQA